MPEMQINGENRKKPSVMNTIRIVLLIVFSAMFLVSAGMLIYQGLEYKRAREENDDARELVGLPDMNNIGKDKDTSGADPTPPTQTPGDSQGTNGSSGAVTGPSQPGGNNDPTYVDPYE